MPKEKQLRYDKAYLRIAKEWGKLSHCKRKQVGALIVKDRMIFLMVIMVHQPDLKTIVKMTMVTQNGTCFTLKLMLFLK